MEYMDACAITQLYIKENVFGIMCPDVYPLSYDAFSNESEKDQLPSADLQNFWELPIPDEWQPRFPARDYHLDPSSMNWDRERSQILGDSETANPELKVSTDCQLLSSPNSLTSSSSSLADLEDLTDWQILVDWKVPSSLEDLSSN